jgi:hypothetical protein
MVEGNNGAFCDYCDFVPDDPNKPNRNRDCFMAGDVEMFCCNVCAQKLNEEDLEMVRNVNIFSYNTW